MSRLDFSAMSDLPVKVREVLLATAAGALRDHQTQMGADSPTPDAGQLEVLVETALQSSLARSRQMLKTAEESVPVLEAACEYMAPADAGDKTQPEN